MDWITPYSLSVEASIRIRPRGRTPSTAAKRSGSVRIGCSISSPPSAAVGTDASLEDIIENKMNGCVRGLRGHASANLHSLMVGLIDKPLLRAVIRETKGNQVRAAQLLGITRNTLRGKLKEHGIDPGVV